LFAWRASEGGARMNACPDIGTGQSVLGLIVILLIVAIAAASKRN
jgi:hypothetical protein